MNPTPSEGREKPQVRRIGRRDGALLSLLGFVTLLKVSSRETLETFFIGEATLPTNAFVPLHYHPDVEVFLVLEGSLEVMHASDGKPEFLPLASGGDGTNSLQCRARIPKYKRRGRPSCGDRRSGN